MRTHKILFIIFISLLMAQTSCNKKDKLTEDVDSNAISFLVIQPSISTATFTAQCTNYDVVLSSVSFLAPNSAFYQQEFNSQTYSKNEAFLIGGWEAIDGLWVIQFKGNLQSTSAPFTASVPFTMVIDGDGDEE